MRNTLVVNFFGESCTGKSTHACGLYTELKKLGVSCELVREYVKEFFYEEKPRVPNQMLITGKQIDMIDKLLGKVDVIITDSPILLGSLYADKYADVFLGNSIRLIARKYNNFNIMLKRDFPFVPEGRGSGAESREMSERVRTIESHMDVIIQSSGLTSYSGLYSMFKERIGKES